MKVFIAATHFFNNSSNNWKYLFFKTISSNSAKVLVVTSLIYLLYKGFLIEVRPSLCGTLGYNPITSNIHTIAFFDKTSSSINCLRKQIVSLM